MIIKAHFELTAAEMANIIGITEATIAQSFARLKKKAIKLSEEAQAQVLHIAD